MKVFFFRDHFSGQAGDAGPCWILESMAQGRRIAAAAGKFPDAGEKKLLYLASMRRRENSGGR